MHCPCQYCYRWCQYCDRCAGINCIRTPTISNMLLGLCIGTGDESEGIDVLVSEYDGAEAFEETPL
jgi:hypothetical protein